MYSFPNFQPVHCIMSSSNCYFLTWYRFLRRQVKWSGTPISLRIFHTLLWSTWLKDFIVDNEAEVNVFLEFSCIFYDPIDVDNLISCSSTFSKFSLNTWKFLVHQLLKPSLENFQHFSAGMWDECNCELVWTFFGNAFLWDSNENHLSSPVATDEISKFAGILMQHFNSIIF